MADKVKKKVEPKRVESKKRTVKRRIFTSGGPAEMEVPVKDSKKEKPDPTAEEEAKKDVVARARGRVAL